MSRIRDAGYTKARRQYTPTLSVFGSLDWNSDVSEDFENSYMVGAQAQVALFDGFRRRASVSGAAAQVEHRPERAGQILFGLSDAQVEAFAGREAAGDGRGEGAAGAVGVGVVHAFGGVAADLAVVAEDVHCVVHKVSALHEHRASRVRGYLSGSTHHVGLVFDGKTAEDFGLRNVGRDDGAERNENGFKR